MMTSTVSGDMRLPNCVEVDPMTFKVIYKEGLIDTHRGRQCSYLCAQFVRRHCVNMIN